MKQSALIAMSGGVDSSVAALLLIRRGMRCTGAMMKLVQDVAASEECNRTCCSAQDAMDARDVAYRLGIPFYVFNFTSAFTTQVIDRFVASWQSGSTPNPCIDCNRYLKFDKFLLRARELDYDCIATGHYARIEYDVSGGRYLLRKGLDEEKDQSYVLYTMTQEQLSQTLMPLGWLKKSQVRALAEKNSLVNARKKESQDICFVPDGDYAGFIEHYMGEPSAPGDFLDMSGERLGRHQGLIRYTTGQRRGMGISSTHPLYVCGKDTAANTVTLGPEQALYVKRLVARDINLIQADQLHKPLRVRAKVRYRQNAQWATVEQIAEDCIQVCFDHPQRAVTPGQAVVLYDDDVVVGGGTIQIAE